jgi:hypothetical protein
MPDAVLGPAPETSLRTPSRPLIRPVNRVAERLFFGGMALLTAAMVVTGFSHSYFAAGMLRAPLPNLLVHVHAAVFTSWMILFLVQTALVSARRVAWHRALGTVAYLLPIIMVPLGTITGLDELRRERTFDSVTGLAHVPPFSAGFFAESLLGIVLFAVVVYASWGARRTPAAHKRLVLLATIGLSSGALIRFPWRAMGLGFLGANAAVIALGTMLLLVVAYDLTSLRRLHRSTMWAAPLTFVVFALTDPIAHTGVWMGFVTFLARRVAPLL